MLHEMRLLSEVYLRIYSVIMFSLMFRFVLAGSRGLYFAQTEYQFYFTKDTSEETKVGKLFPLMNNNTQEECLSFKYIVKNNVKSVVIADTGWVTIKDPTALPDQTRIQLEVVCLFHETRITSTDIQVILTDESSVVATDSFLCFGDNNLKFQIEENFNFGIVGSLVNLPSALTKHISKEYLFLVGGLCSYHMSIRRNSSEMSFIKPFDRESMDRLKCKLTCRITRPNTKIVDITRDMMINVTDMNDNPPLFQVNRTQEKDVDSPSSDISVVLVDADLETRPKYASRVINDYLSLCNTTIHGVMPYKNKKNPQFSGSAILLGVKFGDLTKLKRVAHVKEYVCEIEIENIGYIGPRDKSSKAVLRVNLKKQSKKKSDPPVIETIPLNRNARKYHQIKRYSEGRSYTYSLDNESGRTFGITGSGILYLKKEDFWISAQSHYLVNVSAKFNGYDVATPIRITVYGVSSEIRNCDTSCSLLNNKRDCERSCGLASPTGKCVWRKDTTGKVSLTSRYDTCTPNVNTCPDSKCDEVEKLNKLICPQDCTRGSSNGEMKMNPGGGIKIARGPCWCDRNAKCQCWHDEVELLTSTATPRMTVSPLTSVTDIGYFLTGQQALQNETVANIVVDGNLESPGAVQTYLQVDYCDTACQTGIFLGAALACFAVVLLFLLWRRRQRRRTNSASLKHVTSVGSMAAVPSEYVDDREILSSPKSSNHSNKQNTCHKWIFPRENLTLAETLGEGEFGMVVKATATGLDNHADGTTVAVKMVKNYSNDTELQDLLSEFTLLQEVNHPNVIKLLGACINDGGPLYVIVEYCENGSLRTYLRKCRVIDTSLIGALWDQEKFENGNENSEMSVLTMRCLMSFAWQVAKGMRYLSEMKLVHRDLAARNILVGKNRLLKISDFGLTRDVYEADAYLKKSKGRIPVKWMAPESLYAHIYTSQSDVWSYGVMLWEIVTLGANPYPGILPERLFNLLKTGYRMDRPEECPDELYAVMQKCWKSEPSQRPSFGSLADIFERMLRQKTGYLEVSPLIPSPEKQLRKASAVQTIEKHIEKEVVEDDTEQHSDVELSYLLPKEKGSITSESFDSDEQLNLLRDTGPHTKVYKNRNLVGKTAV